MTTAVNKQYCRLVYANDNGHQVTVDGGKGQRWRPTRCEGEGESVVFSIHRTQSPFSSDDGAQQLKSQTRPPHWEIVSRMTSLGGREGGRERE